MRATTTWGVPYPEPEDPGAWGTQLEYLASEVEGQLNAVDVTYQDLAQPQSAVLTITGTQGPIANDTLGTIDFNSTVYAPNSPYSGKPVANNVTTFVTSIDTLAVIDSRDAGWYLVDAFAQMDPSGAVTANSYRQLICTVFDNTSLPAIPVDVFIARDYDTGVVDLSVAVSFLTRMSGNSYILFQYEHGNAASTVSLIAARVSMTRICPLVT